MKHCREFYECQQSKSQETLPLQGKRGRSFISLQIGNRLSRIKKIKIFQTTFHHKASARVNDIHLPIKQMYSMDSIVREQLCLRDLPGLRNSNSSSHREDKHWVRGPDKWGNLHLWRCSAHKVLSNLTQL